MATEINGNKYTSKIKKNNLEKISEKVLLKNAEIYEERLKQFSQPKKRYYLASCDENIGMLKKE